MFSERPSYRRRMTNKMMMSEKLRRRKQITRSSTVGAMCCSLRVLIVPPCGVPRTRCWWAITKELARLLADRRPSSFDQSNGSFLWTTVMRVIGGALPAIEHADTIDRATLIEEPTERADDRTASHHSTRWCGNVHGVLYRGHYQIKP